MDVSARSLPDSINPNNFVAKLWRLVNNPAIKAICWDREGQAVIINKHLLETQILFPGTGSLDNADTFRMSKLSSFFRQLNLYGFRKAFRHMADSNTRENLRCCFFFNPNFKQDHPELLVSLRRLTAENKAKMKASEDVTIENNRLSVGDDGRDNNVIRGSFSLHGLTHQESPHPYYPHGAQAMTAHNGSPVPPQFLTRAHAATFSPTVFTIGRGIPVPSCHHYTAIDLSNKTTYFQQDLLAHANQGSDTLNVPYVQYQPGNYTPPGLWYHQNLVASYATGSGLQTGPFSPHSDYQHHSQVPKKEHQEMKNCDSNSDTIFQTDDEMMPAPPYSGQVTSDDAKDAEVIEVKVSDTEGQQSGLQQQMTRLYTNL